MIGECRDEAYDAFRHALRGFGEGMVRVDGGIGKLIKTAAEFVDETFFEQAGDGGRDAFLDEFGQARHSLPFEQGKSTILLGLAGRVMAGI